MGLERLHSGKKVGEDINVVIEIPSHSDPIKYELDRQWHDDGRSFSRYIYVLSL